MYLNLKSKSEFLLQMRRRRRRSLISTILILVSSFYFCFNLLPNFFCHEKQLAQYQNVAARSSFLNPLKIVYIPRIARILRNSRKINVVADYKYAQGNSSSFNKYAFLTARNSYPTYGKTYGLFKGIIWCMVNQRPSRSRTVTEQLNSGIRAFILKIYDSPRGEEGIWVGQSVHDRGQSWFDTYTSVLPILKDIEEFLSSNPFEILTLILEDCVKPSDGLTKVFEAARLTKYLLPLEKMPRHGGDWPLVKDMVAANQRLVVFISNESKEKSEGIAYKGNFMIECKYGNTQTSQPPCIEGESLPGTYDTSKSLVLLNYYTYARFSKGLMNAIRTCYAAASNRWVNFIVVDNEEDKETRQAFYYFVDFLNGKHLCGCYDVNSCKGGSSCPLMAGLDMLCWGREAFFIRVFHQFNIIFIWIVMCFFYCLRP